MTQKKADHDAPGQAAGYLFQPEKALLWLATSPDTAIVGVETGDDVVVVADGQVRYGQLKNTGQGQSNPFADRSVGLWKTLSIWTTKVAGGVNVEHVEFYFCTNRVIPAKCIASRAAAASTNQSAMRVVDAIRKIAADPADTIAKFATLINRISDPMLMAIILRIRVEDTAPDASIRAQTIQRMQLPSNIAKDHVYDACLGWLCRTLKSAWDSGSDGWITAQAFANQKQRILDELRRDALSARAARSIGVTQEERNAKRDELCVRQLQLVDAADDEIIDAIDELIKESKEIMRLFELGVITKRSFEERNVRLHSRWKQIYRRNCRALTAENGNDVETGYRTFSETTDHNEPLADILPQERYFTAGALHRLANNSEADHFIGWHPSYRSLLFGEH